MPHTPGPWRNSAKHAYGAIVADGPTGSARNYSVDSAATVKAYGGHLVCESIWHAGNKRLVIAAPDLLAACETALGALLALKMAGLDKGATAPEIEQLKKAIEKATEPEERNDER